MKYLKSAECSRLHPYKICIICNSKRRLEEISLEAGCWAYKWGNEKRCGYVLFLYCRAFREAIKIREWLYSYKNLYVFLQDDRQILQYYDKVNPR